MSASSLPHARPQADPFAIRRLITAPELAQMLGCSVRTVIRLAARGMLPPGLKLGRLRRWNVTDVEAYVAAGSIVQPKSQERDS
jgi:excisionase family DNA binding protein